MDINQLPDSAHGINNDGRRDSFYMKTLEAARYMRRSISWLLRQKDIPYLPGKPNLYARQDLDDWFERNKHNSMI